MNVVKKDKEKQIMFKAHCSRPKVAKSMKKK